MPTDRKVPTAATSMPRASQVWWASAAPVMVMVLLTNPENSGKPEMLTAATMYQTKTHGRRRNRPPSSESLAVPAAWSSAPAPMNSRPL